MGKSITFVDGDGVGDTISGVEDETGSSARGVKGQNSLDGQIESGDFEVLEHDLGHPLSVLLGVSGGLG